MKLPFRLCAILLATAFASMNAESAMRVPLYFGAGAAFSQVSFESYSSQEIAYFLGPTIFPEVRLLTTLKPKESKFHLEAFATYGWSTKKNVADSNETLKQRTRQLGIDAVFGLFLRGRLFIGGIRNLNQINVSGSSIEQNLSHTSYGPRAGIKYFWSEYSLFTVGVSYETGNQRFMSATQNVSRIVDEYSVFTSFEFRVF